MNHTKNSPGPLVNSSCDVVPQHVSVNICLCLVFILGFVLNSFSLWVFLFRMPKWSSSTHLQFHLALTDTISMPIAPLTAAYLAIGGHWMCQLNIALHSMHFYGSIAFLTLISVHRYVAVVHFNRASLMKQKEFVKKLCGGMWCLLTIMALILAFLFRLPNVTKVPQCLSINYNSLTNSYLIANFIIFIFGFLIPFSVSVFCHHRVTNTLDHLHISVGKGLAVKVKSQKMISACLVIFGLCFLPLNVARTVGVVYKKYYPKQCGVIHQLETAYHVCLIWAALNCCLDPMLYCYGSCNFKNAFGSVKMDKRDVPKGSESEHGT